ncbi:MAG: ABC transporter substrate-binding protein [Candidatus Eisenbacteria bacterium]|nr:ABC transporter substrate-binding protein [Candidatus Eisenbacteria bacterium]
MDAQRIRGRTAARLLATAALATVLLATLLAGCTGELRQAPPGVLVVSVEQHSSWIRNFNPLTTAAAVRWPTLAGVYEPLYVFNSVKSEFVPWLAVEHEWRENNLVLRIRTRQGVRWSDGEPFSARDVYFTFELMRENPALDRRGSWNFLEDVRLVDENTVDFRFERLYVPGFGEIAAQLIVPEHIWKDIEDPVAYPNQNPVATGPFTEVRLFRNQVYELGRNPHYWQEGKPAVEALRFPAYPSNDRANLALVFDEVDWAGNFVPAIDRVFVARSPETHDYWFPLTGSTIFLYVNTTRPPFDDVRVRKAFSLAVDRDLLVDVALYRYSRPADATALSDAFVSWKDPLAVAEGTWVDYDVERANELLDEAGYEWGEEGFRLDEDGEPLSFEVLTVSGWSDWVRGAQVISRGFEEIGVEASVRTYDFGAWFQRVQEGDFDLSLGWSYEGPTPYTFYRWLMSSKTVEPVGEIAPGNWHRFASARADSVFDAFEGETDLEGQMRLAARLQRIFVEEAPAIPLYPNPSWAEFNTGRFVGFPTEDDPYADPSPNKFDRGECLLVLTTLRPRE